MLGSKLTAVFMALFAQLPLRSQPTAKPPPTPAERFWVATDNIPKANIAGVVLPATGKPKGTLFICHGYNRRKEGLYGLDWVRRQLGWNLVLFDFREHGQSSRSIHLCTLGYNEIWDVKAVVDYAERQGLAKPYAIYGVSMGGSTGTRWAAQDPRIKGVLAMSPYRNGLEACREYIWGKFQLSFNTIDLHAGLKKMLSAVDLPTDVAARNDLRLWILCGENDYWSVADEEAILDASPSPDSFKKLFVIPGGNHGNLWAWKGNRTIPGHDQIVRDFLHSCR